MAFNQKPAIISSAWLLNSELLMCRKIGCNRNVKNCVNKTEFGRIVLNLICYFASITKLKVVAILPNAPKVGSGGLFSPRGDWRAPSDSEATAWLKELEENVPDELLLIPLKYKK